jgi:hypothetical protein
MTDTFIMRWPELGRQVVCERLGHNKEQFDWWVSQLPLRAVQGHIMVAGWGLYAFMVPLRQRVTWVPRTEVIEEIRLQKEGRVDLFMPMGSVASILVKYGEFTETMSYPTFAQVREADLPALREVGAAVWRSEVKTKKIYTVEYLKAEGA